MNSLTLVEFKGFDLISRAAPKFPEVPRSCPKLPEVHSFSSFLTWSKTLFEQKKCKRPVENFENQRSKPGFEQKKCKRPVEKFQNPKFLPLILDELRATSGNFGELRGSFSTGGQNGTFYEILSHPMNLSENVCSSMNFNENHCSSMKIFAVQ